MPLNRVRFDRARWHPGHSWPVRRICDTAHSDCGASQTAPTTGASPSVRVPRRRTLHQAVPTFERGAVQRQLGAACLQRVEGVLAKHEFRECHLIQRPSCGRGSGHGEGRVRRRNLVTCWITKEFGHCSAACGLVRTSIRAFLAQLGERTTEDRKVPCSIHVEGIVSFLPFEVAATRHLFFFASTTTRKCRTNKFTP